MIKIDNRTNLPYKIIGKLYDEHRLITIYDGMKEIMVFGHKRKEYKMTIEYKTTQINITVEEVNVLAKKVSKKGLKFPKLK